MTDRLRITFLGLSITSSWGNGHATTYRSLVRALTEAGHEVTFLERDVPYYAANRDLPHPPWGETRLYRTLRELKADHATPVRDADLVVVGSYVPSGVAVADWILDTARGATAFYDIDTPVTLAKLARGDHEYLHPRLIPRFDAYLSFTGGPTLRYVERAYGAPTAKPLYCSVDPDLYHPERREAQWDLGYLGTYSDDRQPKLDRLLLDAARSRPTRSFVVAGSQYPEEIAWPRNVERIDHLPPDRHRGFYNAQRFTLNVTRDDMVKAGWSPSVRLFEAAACATPVVSDVWPGLDHFFRPGEEILLATGPDETLQHIGMDDGERRRIGEAARKRVLRAHTCRHRAAELASYAREILDAPEAKEP